MPFNIDAVDEVPVADGCATFKGGQVSDARPSIIAPEAASSLLNMLVEPNGDVTTRQGVARIGEDLVQDLAGDLTYAGGVFIQGIHNYYIGGSGGWNKLLAINKRALFKLDYGASDWTIVSGYLAGALSIHTQMHVCTVQGKDLMFFADVFSNIMQWDGTTFIDLSAMPDGPSPCPFGAPCIIWHTDRLFAMGMSDLHDTLSSSGILEPNFWNTNTDIRVGAGDGEPISGGAIWVDFKLVILKLGSIWVVDADPQLDSAEWTVKRITNKMGVRAWRTWKMVGNDMVGLTTKHGVRSILRTQASDTRQEIGQSLSYPVDDVIRRINPDKMELCHAAVRGTRYILFMPLDTAEQCNYALVWDSLTETWSGTWTGWEPTCTAERVRGTLGNAGTSMVFGDRYGRAKEWLDYILLEDEVQATYLDDEASIPSQIKARALNFGDAQCPKTGFQYEIEYKFNNFDDGTAFVRQFNEVGDLLDASEDTLSVEDGTLKRESFDLMEGGQFRELQFDVQASQGKLSLKRIAATAFPDTLVLQT